MRSALLIGALLLAAPLFTAPSAQAQDGIGSLIDSRVVFPASASQGALVIGKVPAGSRVQYAGRQLRVSGYGSVVFGIGRDEKGPLRVQVQRPDGGSETATIAVTPRDWPTERVNGVPPKTVNPPPAIAERIKREQAQVTAARARDDDRTDFTQTFIWPVQGRISGRFGNARVYNGQPGAGHSGMDIAVPTGTPVKAPAAGIVTFAGPDLYLTGGTLLLDHGFGVSSNFLHLSRIDVKVGDRVEQGQVIAAVGATVMFRRMETRNVACPLRVISTSSTTHAWAPTWPTSSPTRIRRTAASPSLHWTGWAVPCRMPPPLQPCNLPASARSVRRPRSCTAG